VAADADRQTSVTAPELAQPGCRTVEDAQTRSLLSTTLLILLAALAQGIVVCSLRSRAYRPAQTMILGKPNAAKLGSSQKW
jgi:hypothetical protein